MRVLLDARVVSDRLSGVGRYAYGLARHLPAAMPGVEFVIAYNPRVPNERFQWRALDPVANARLVECAGSGLGALDWPALGRLARRERVDLLHAPHCIGAFASPVPAVTTIHDLIPFDPGTTRAVRGTALRFVLRDTARRARVVVVPTETMRVRVRDFFALEDSRVVAVPPGLDLPSDGSSPPGLDPGRPYVLYVGVHRPHKNIEGLLAGFAHSLSAGAEALVIAGTFSEHTPAYRRISGKMGLADRVLFTGHVGEAALGGLIRHAAVLALVSFAEGFGVPPLEAMSVGVPAVVSDLPVFRETCGDAAIFVDPNSPEAIGAGLCEALRGGVSRAARLEAGARRARALSWPVLAPGYLRLYEAGVRP